MLPSFIHHPSSYRDPAGFVFYKDATLFRQVNQAFKKEFDHFTASGLYQHLVEKKILIPHQTIPENLTSSADWYTTLQPETIPFISYPYEWCFDMLKDAALLTLEAAKEAIAYQMMLRDASAYNIQLHNGKPIFIDTLSFEHYDDKKPWIAYRQFCEHFFAPLALMHYLKQPLQNLFIAYPDGIPLTIAASMLPFQSKLSFHGYLHLHLQNSISKKIKAGAGQSKVFSKQKMKNLLQSLEDGIKSFSFQKNETAWSNYYEEANQRADYITSKKSIINKWLDKLSFKLVLDAGANEGEFSELAAKKSAYVISMDADHTSINKLYNKFRHGTIPNIYPMVIDLANPSPAIGVNNQERTSFLNRIKVDLVLALALIHHLVLGRNIPFNKVAEMFYPLTRYLIIEFVPADDKKVEIMTSHKKNLLVNYSEENFTGIFQNYFSLLDKQIIAGTGRTLFLMEKHNA